MKKFNKGFTLIELLVVIAIIGILSSVVLASLNTARAKGADSAIKGNINSVRSQATIFYDNGNTYTGVCADTNVTQAITAATAAGGLSAGCIASTTGASFASWSKLKTDQAIYFCVDSNGYAGTTTAAATSTKALCL